MPWIPLAIGAALGVAKGMQDQSNEKAQRQVAAATINYSPWTKSDVNESQKSIHPANVAGDIAQGLMGGYLAQPTASGLAKGVSPYASGMGPSSDPNSFGSADTFSTSSFWQDPYEPMQPYRGGNVKPSALGYGG